MPVHNSPYTKIDRPTAADPTPTNHRPEHCIFRPPNCESRPLLNQNFNNPGTNRIEQQIWGVRYIDDPLIRRIDRDADGDYFPTQGDDIYFHLTDSQFSTVALINHNAILKERTEYDAYGQARHHHPMDLDGDGDARDTNDVTVFQAATPSTIGQTKYNADCDIDRDGDVDSADQSAADALYGTNVIPALPSGYISDTNPTTGPDNPIGYDGYVFNSSTNIYTVRFRHYDPHQGRWLERDRMQYVDGENLYQYVYSDPLRGIDPEGQYEIDVHKDLTKYLAKKLPCFSDADAAAIANADQGTDENPETAPGSGLTSEQQRKNREFHALNPGEGVIPPGEKPGIPRDYFGMLWRKATFDNVEIYDPNRPAGVRIHPAPTRKVRNCSLAALGRALHYAQDSFSHGGYSSDVYGHFFSPGHAADKTSNDVEKAMRMAGRTNSLLHDWLKACRPGCYCDKMSSMDQINN